MALTRFWYVRGYLSEGRRWLERPLQQERPLSTLPSAGARSQPVASFALLQGDYTVATALAEESLVVARASEDPRLVANALSNLGAIVLAGGDTERAERLLEEAVPLARGVGDERIAALAINNLGDLALTVGDLERAEPLFQESLELAPCAGDTANVARALFNLGAVALSSTGSRRPGNDSLRASSTDARPGTRRTWPGAWRGSPHSLPRTGAVRTRLGSSVRPMRS